MKKAISLITAAFLWLFCCSCGESRDGEEIFEELKSEQLSAGAENNYYLRISETSAGIQTLTEASRLDDDCAFLINYTDGKTEFFRKGKYYVISPETFYTSSASSAEWEDFGYDETAQKYSKIYSELMKNDSYTVETKESGDDDAPYKITVKYNVDDLDTKALFQNDGNYGSVTVTFLTDKKGSVKKNVTLNCQHDYKSTIYIYSLQFGTPNPPDSDGNNGQRPIDIKKIFESYSESIKST